MVKKYVLSCLAGLMGLFCVPSLLTSTMKATTSRTRLSEPLKLPDSQTAYDFSEEVEIPDGNLVVTATSSTKTSMGQSFTLMFSTGGQGWSDSTSTFLLAPDDSSFEDYYAELIEKPVEEREQMTEDYERGLRDPDRFNSYVFSLKSASSINNIVIPRSLTRNHIFNLDVVRLGVNVVPDWTGITSITIPSDVAEIYEDSFQNIPDGMVFNVEPASNPEGWAANWNHGATVNYGYAYPASKAEPLSKAGAEQYGDVTQNFILGWYPREGEQEPLIVEYKIGSETRYFEFTPSSSTSLFECVGRQVNDFTKSLYCDIPLSDGEAVDFDSVVIHNIYRTKTKDNGEAKPEPNLDQAYSVVPKKGFSREYNVEDFINCTFTGLSTFSGFTVIDLNVNISNANVYSHLKTNYYNAHLNDINSGKVKVRTRLTSLTLCNFRITYATSNGDETKDVKIEAPKDFNQVILKKNNNNKVSFLIQNSKVAKGFSTKNIRSVSFVGLYLTLDLLGTKSTVARSNVITRFGFFPVMPYSNSAKLFDVNALLIILAIAYILAFVAGTIGLYFFLKNKYKNDEFRRMKNKPFFKKAVLFLLGSLIVLFDIVFIILRGTALNNAIVVFNPADAYIIVLSVLSVIIIGYFIKFMVGVVKTNKERRRILKLKLNEDVEDDGTN